ncbi:MAG TPA: 1-(5-phosphoribosyl)-5-[(5-phosphoribosylamino)methylideneamino]imidazole-4-carboxamide isomerase [Dehalococcoidia bacterium]|nr:1-(5-phosphoribosyl)-5-[(5-phosphoribosylamino)methylideneamino]imidazole-4-carboxamide isomerase [Dehalococcoidia bacterium]
MDIIPAIDVRGGKCVRLVQGDYGRERVFNDDPVAQGRRFAEEGARRLHVVDLDGAKEGRPVNDDAIAAIVAAVPGVRVQVAGGVREAAAVERWLAAGADRVVLGTVAVRQPEVVAQAVERHGAERVAVAVDARDGAVAVQGWQETSELTAEALMRGLALRGVRHFIYTDIGRDGMLQHVDFAGFERLLDAVGGGVGRDSVVYSGGVTSTDDVRRLAGMGIAGAIIGTALYDGRITLRDALEAAKAGGRSE